MFTPFGLAAGIIMLGILVFVHEFGHFCVAKLAGVKVLKFSLGFGPRLVSRTWGETEYMICAIPLGGYVQMLGEGGGEEGEAAPLSEEERARSFAARPVGQRTAIVAAGPLMNLLLPFLVLPLAYMVGVDLPAFLERPACIGHVVTGSEAAGAGFRAGDCLTALNDEPVATWTEADHALLAHAGTPLVFTVAREGASVNVPFTPKDGGLEGLQSLGLRPRQPATVGAVTPGMPAQAAGVAPGDHIRAIDARPVGSWYELREIIQQSEGKALSFFVERSGTQLTLTVTPVQDEVDGAGYLIGIVPQEEKVFRRFGPVEAFKAGAERTLDLIKLTLVFIQKLFAGHVSTKNIGGPITVVQLAGQAAQTDLATIFTFLAFLSIQLGILNLLPIPILDGGHLFFNLFELVLRRPLSLRAREIAQQIGLVLLVLLMALAFYNDIVRLFGS
jgi:regulator of sigma E protease